MSTEVRWRRGTTAENDNFTGAEAEITVDTERKELRVHDGATAGGKASLTEEIIGTGGDKLPTNNDLRVDTIADLKALDTTDARSVYVYGYFDKGDGGGGTFHWDGSRTKSDHNGGTVIDPDHSSAPDNTDSNWYISDNSGDGVWVRKDNVIRAEHFGAIPDGENGTNLWTALQQAIWECPEGGVLMLGQGDYRVDDALEVDKPLEIRGTGPGGSWPLTPTTRLYLRTGTHGFTFADTVAYYELKDLKLFGSQDKSALSDFTFANHDFGNCALRMTAGTPVWTYNLRIKDWDSAWVRFRDDDNGDSWGGAYSYTDSVYVKDCHYGVVMYDYVTDGRFNNCEVRECTAGLWLEGNTGYHTSHWTNCMFEKMGTDYSSTTLYSEAGIWVGNTALARFYGCYAENVSFYAGTKGQIEFGGFVKRTCDAAGHGILDFTGCSSHWTRLDETILPPVYDDTYWAQTNCSWNNTYSTSMNNGATGIGFDVGSSGARLVTDNGSNDTWAARLARTLPSYDQVEQYAYQVQLEFQVDSTASTAAVPVVDFGQDFGNISASVILSEHEASGGSVNSISFLVFVRNDSSYQDTTSGFLLPTIWLDWNTSLSSGDVVTIRRFRVDLLCMQG